MATELAAAYVTIIPSLKGAGKTVENALGGVNTTATGKRWGNNLSGGLGSGLAKAAGFGVKAVGAIGAAVGGLAIGGGISRAMKIDQAEMKFKALGINVESAMKSCNEAVTGTAFGLDSAATVASMLGASGVKAGNQMTTALKGAAGMAAMGGVELERVGSVYAKVAAQGKLQGDELMQFSEMGVNALGALADYFGVTQAKAREMVKNGEVDFAEFSAAMNKMYGDAAKGANETFSGAMANVMAALSRLGAKFASPALEGLRKVFVALIPAIDAISSRLDPLVDKFTAFVEAVSGNAVTAIESFTNTLNNGGSFIDAFKSAFNSLPESVQSVISKFTALAGVIGGSVIASKIASIGSSVVAFAPKISKFATSLVGFGSKLPLVGGLFTALGGKMSMFGRSMVLCGGGVKGFATVLGGVLAGPVGIVLGLVAALAAAFIYLWNTNDQFKNSMMQLGSEMMASITPCLQQLGNTLMQLANAFIPVITGLANALVPILTMIVQVIGQVLVAIMPVVTTLISALVPVITQVIGIVAQIATALLTSLTPVITVIGSVIQALVPIILQIVSMAMPIISQIISMISGLLPIILQIAQMALPMITQVIQMMMPIIMQIVTLIRQLMPTIMQIISMVLPMIMQIISMVLPMIMQIAAMVMPIIQQIMEVIMSNMPQIMAIVTTVMNVIMTVIQTVMPIILSIIQAVWPVIKVIITTVMNVIKSVIMIVMGIINGNWSQVWNGIKSLVSSVWNGIKNFIRTAINAVKSVISSVLNGIKSIWNSVWGSIKSFVSDTWENVKNSVSNGVDSVIDFVSSLPDKIMGFFSDAGSWLVDSGKKIIDGLKEGITNAFGSAKKALEDGLSTLRNLLPFSPAKEGPFSGKGWTLYSGQSIVEGLADGIAKRSKTAQAAMNSVMSGISEAASIQKSDIAPFDDVNTDVRTWRNVKFTDDTANMDEIIGLLSNYLPEMAKEKQLVMDTGVVAGALTPAIDKNLGKKNVRRSKGL